MNIINSEYNASSLGQISLIKNIYAPQPKTQKYDILNLLSKKIYSFSSNTTTKVYRVSFSFRMSNTTAYSMYLSS